jgi:hypothetical protein
MLPAPDRRYWITEADQMSDLRCAAEIEPRSGSYKANGKAQFLEKPISSCRRRQSVPSMPGVTAAEQARPVPAIPQVTGFAAQFAVPQAGLHAGTQPTNCTRHAGFVLPDGVGHGRGPGDSLGGALSHFALSGRSDFAAGKFRGFDAVSTRERSRVAFGRLSFLIVRGTLRPRTKGLKRSSRPVWPV